MARPIRVTDAMIEKYIKGGYWEWATFADLFERWVDKQPDKEFLADTSVRLTWGQAKKQVDRIALGLLQSGIKRDEVIVIMLHNCAEWVLFWLGCQKAGILSLSLMMTLRHEELKSIVKMSEARGIVIPMKYRNLDYYDMVKGLTHDLPGLKHIFMTGEGVPEGAISVKQMIEEPLEERFSIKDLEKVSFKADETIQLGQTSGSTGLPKIYETFGFVGPAFIKHHIKRLKMTEDDVILAAAPFAGGPGGGALRLVMGTGSRLLILENFEVEEILGLVERERVTAITLVPTILMRIGAHPDLNKYDLSSLRFIRAAGAPLSYEQAMDIEQRIGAPIVNGYGATDWGHLATPCIDDPPEIRLGTCGKPWDGNEFRLLDEAGNEVAPGEAGLVVGRGPFTTGGFYKDPERTFEMWDKDGWATTGDIAKFDEQGNLVLVGRQKDMIIRGGQNIYPIEVERLLLAHPKVSNVAIVGMPDAEMGEKACAFIIPRTGQEFGFEEMVSYLKEKQLAPFKLPERLEIVDSLPLLGGGKIDKRTLSARLTGESTAGK
ncbi:AMP-binding protein [Chloroflexota bacterium]